MLQKINIKGSFFTPLKFYICSIIQVLIFFLVANISAQSSLPKQETLLKQSEIPVQTQETSIQESSPSELSEIIDIQKQGEEDEINNLLKEIDKLIKAGHFDKAAAKFKIINEKYRKLGMTDYTEDKLKGLKIKEDDFYKKWSSHLEAETNTAYKNEQWENSIKFAKESIDVLKKSNDSSNPQIAEDKKIIEIAEKQVANKIFQKEVSLPNLIPNNKENKSNIDLYFIKAETFIKNKQYDKARDSLEQILVIDPYNFKAMYMLKNVYGKLFKVAKNRTNVYHRNTMAQVKWAYSTGVSPNLTKGDEQLTKVTIAGKSSDSIRDKLKNIIIKKLDFDDATVSSVISYLSKESKRLDETDNAGISIILRVDDDTEDTLERITMSMDEIPFEEALKYICLATDLQYKIEEHAVIIGNESLTKMRTEFFTIKSDIINSIASDIKITEKRSDNEDIFGTADFGEQKAETVNLTMPKLIEYFTNRGVPFPEGSTVAWDVRANTLTVTNTADNLRIMEKLLKDIDIAVPLVLIETKFVEITDTDLKEFGFDWKIQFESGALANGAEWGINQFNPTQVVSTAAEQTLYSTAGAALGTIQSGNDSIMRHYGTNLNDPTSTASQGALIKDLTFNLPGTSGSSGALSFWLYALDQSNIAEILSAPKVITKSGTTALIRMVEEEFFPISWDKPTASISDNSVQVNQTVPKFENPTDLGIRLKVTPTVSPNNYTILLELHPEITRLVGWTDYSYDIVADQQRQSTTDNEVKYDTQEYLQPVRMPEVSNREVETKVVVYDGSTTVLGGMIRDNTRTFDDSVPILCEIPIIGRLFRSEYKRSIKVNLLIFVTARLIKPDGTPFRKSQDNGLFNNGLY